MDVEHCSFLHHTSMKRKMTSIFEKLLRGKKLYLLNVGKKKIGKTAENHEVTEHDCHQRGNLSSVYITSWNLQYQRIWNLKHSQLKRTWEMLTLHIYTHILHWWIVFRVLGICSSWLPLRTAPNILGTNWIVSPIGVSDHCNLSFGTFYHQQNSLRETE